MPACCFPVLFGGCGDSNQQLLPGDGFVIIGDAGTADVDSVPKQAAVPCGVSAAPITLCRCPGISSCSVAAAVAMTLPPGTADEPAGGIAFAGLVITTGLAEALFCLSMMALASRRSAAAADWARNKSGTAVGPAARILLLAGTSWRCCCCRCKCNTRCHFAATAKCSCCRWQADRGCC